MAKSNKDTQISKTLSYLLRHGGDKAGIQMRPGNFLKIIKIKMFKIKKCLNLKDGFVDMDSLLAHPQLRNSTQENILKIVENCPKQRFLVEYFSDESGRLKAFIRANQGHSLNDVKVDMVELNESDNIEQCFHGTYHKAWESIKQQVVHIFF